MYIKSRQGSEVLRTNYTVTDDINGVPTIETNELQLKDFHDTPIKMLSPSLIDEFVLVIKDEAATSDSSLMKMIGVHRFIYDMNLSRVYDEYTQYFSIENILGLIFDGTEYTFEVKGDKTYYALMFENFGDKDKMSLIQQICSRWEVEYHISGTHVVFGDRRGSLTGNMFRYKMNILDSNINLDISKGATYILGKFGKKAEEDGDEDTYVEKEFLHPLAEQYGKRDADPYSNENITQESTMTEYLKRKIEETWILSIEVEVSDLKGNGQVNVGDTVWAIDERLDIEMQTRVIKLVRYYDINDRVYKTKVTLGNYNFIDSVSNTDQTATDVLEKVVASNKKLESEMARFDNRFNQNRDEIVKEINDEFERQRAEVEADFDVWKLYEEQARENIQQSVDNIVSEMDSIDTTIEEWQNTASSRFNALETDLEDKLGLHALEPFVNRLEANEQGISAVFNRLEMPNIGKKTVNLVLESNEVIEFDDALAPGFWMSEVLPIGTKGWVSFDIKFHEMPLGTSNIIRAQRLRSGTAYAWPDDVTVDFTTETQRVSAPFTVENVEMNGIRIQVSRNHFPGTKTYSNVMVEVAKPGQTEPSPYELHISEQEKAPDVIDRLFGQLDINSDSLAAVFGRVEGNESDIANFQITADGLSSSVGTLRSDLDDMEQWSLVAGSDWQQTKDGFDRYVVANNETVDGLRTDVSNVVERADGISSTVSSMRGDVDDLEAWRADAGSKWEQTSQAITGRVWLDDIATGGANMFSHTDFSSLTDIDAWTRLTGQVSRSWSQFALIQNLNFGSFFGLISEINVEIVKGKTYTVSFLGAHDSGVDTINRVFLLDKDYSSVQNLNQYRKYKYLENPHITGQFNYGLYYFTFTAEVTQTIGICISATHNGDPNTGGWIRLSEPQFEEGNVPSPYKTPQRDFIQHTDFRLQADGFFLGTTFVGGSHYATAIVGDASGLKLIGDKISIDGNLDVLGRIRSESISAVYANISEVRTRILVANSIKANMLDVTQLMAEKFYTHTAFINNASIKAANIRDLDAISISASQISSGVLSSRNGNMELDLDRGRLSLFEGHIKFTEDLNALIKPTTSDNSASFLTFHSGSRTIGSRKQSYNQISMGIAENLGTLDSPVGLPETRFAGISARSNRNNDYYTLQLSAKTFLLENNSTASIVYAKIYFDGADLIIDRGEEGKNGSGIKIDSFGVHVRNSGSSSWRKL